MTQEQLSRRKEEVIEALELWLDGQRPDIIGEAMNEQTGFPERFAWVTTESGSPPVAATVGHVILMLEELRR